MSCIEDPQHVTMEITNSVGQHKTILKSCASKCSKFSRNSFRRFEGEKVNKSTSLPSLHAFDSCIRDGGITAVAVT